MVEMAIVLPMFLIVLFGVTEFSRVLIQRQVLEAAARAGARSASLYRLDCAGVNGEVTQIVNQVMATNPFTTGQTATATVTNPCSTSPTQLKCVNVQIPNNWGVLGNFMGWGNFILQATVGMRPEAAIGAGTPAACP